MNTNYGLTVDLHRHGPVDQVKGDEQQMLTQMVRELLMNVVKHSGVREAFLESTCDNGELRIVVQDKGRGFNAKFESNKPGDMSKFGLFSVRERLNLLNGKMIIESPNEHGTRITIIFPYVSC